MLDWYKGAAEQGAVLMTRERRRDDDFCPVEAKNRRCVLGLWSIACFDIDINEVNGARLHHIASVQLHRP